ncbi:MULTISPECIES: GNAT family N-acetyltransferase [Bacillaceae]|uniref:GNAT family N-acetyltransferase n=1 Tax=Bacillaceae TaxID=186817 RepID=UPI000BFB956E|nr:MULTISPECIES: GNAT family N-acetyltransferase [Bacillaceae]PGT82988.1 GNAT family N-acetyltransferase [Bacillus sp. AFS040349]UGB29488.1 GNAT family N-acetyltransferase [Metabacillus sp. B2-18]
MINSEEVFIKEFEEKDKEDWNAFVERSKNGTFLHKIEYMHYHLDRFNDCSLILKNAKNKIVAILPGNVEGDFFYSHKGLTYGGLLILPETKLEDVMIYFNRFNQYLREEKNIKKVFYKAIPYIYSSIPAQEDEYALFRHNAKLTGCGISSAILMENCLPFSTLRKRGIKKAKKWNLEIKKDYSYEDFWRVLTENLEYRHDTKPVHTLNEIIQLKNRFKENIELYSVYMEGECVAGVLMYITENVAHVQYISANQSGKEISALDFLFDYLINQRYSNVRYFDFGTSVEKQGFFLNEGLSFQKQGFGARGVVYQYFEYDLN